MGYRSTKTYGHDLGFSCAFRQWRAESHCAQLHGYALAIRIEFGAVALDKNKWVIDFGGLKDLKAALQDTFDHKTLVAEDDPQFAFFQEGERLGVMDVVVVPNTGCESFAKLVFEAADKWLRSHEHASRCHVVSVEVKEHGANSAIYTGG